MALVTALAGGVSRLRRPQLHALTAGSFLFDSSFPGNEDPISESGKWAQNGAVTGLDWTNVRTDGTGKAFGRQLVSAPANDDDSCACLSGFGADQYVKVFFRNAQTFGSSDFECEILLRCTMSAHNIVTFEFDIVNAGAGKSTVILAKWNGLINDFTKLVDPWATNVATATGDSLQAGIVGNIITLYDANNNQIGTPFDSSAHAIASGQPGMGFWNQGGDSSAHIGDFAISRFIANDSLIVA